MSAYLVLKWLHVLAAVLVVGLMLVLLRLDARRADARALRPAVEVAARMVPWLLAPGLLALLVTGVAMSAGPLSYGLPPEERGAWIVLGMGLWALLAAFAGGAVFLLARGLVASAEAGRGPAADRLGAQLRWSALLGLLTGAAGVAVMVFRPF